MGDTGVLIITQPDRPLDWRERQERTYHAGKEPCYVCGRPLTAKAEAVDTWLGSAIVLQGEVDINDPAYSGGAQVGPECMRRLRTKAGLA